MINNAIAMNASKAAKIGRLIPTIDFELKDAYDVRNINSEECGTLYIDGKSYRCSFKDIGHISNYLTEMLNELYRSKLKYIEIKIFNYISEMNKHEIDFLIDTLLIAKNSALKKVKLGCA